MKVACSCQKKTNGSTIVREYSKEAKSRGSTDNRQASGFNNDVKMTSILNRLVDRFSAAVRAAYPDLPQNAPCQVTLSSKQSDYQFNGAMPIAGLLKVYILNIKTILFS